MRISRYRLIDKNENIEETIQNFRDAIKNLEKTDSQDGDVRLYNAERAGLKGKLSDLIEEKETKLNRSMEDIPKEINKPVLAFLRHRGDEAPFPAIAYFNGTTYISEEIGCDLDELDSFGCEFIGWANINLRLDEE